MVYKKDKYIVIAVKNGFIVYNTSKEFNEGHTHLKSFNACKTIIDLSIRNKIPRSNSFYYLRSLIRITDNNDYKQRIEELIEVKRDKGKKNYRNK